MAMRDMLKATTAFVEKYILISLFLAYSEVKVSGKALIYILVCPVQLISRLNSGSKSQMFTLLSGRHVGVPKWYTNIAAPYWAL